MAGGGGAGAGVLGDHDPLSVGSYSQLLLSDDIVDDLDAENCFNFAASFSTDHSAPTMLCFGDDHSDRGECDLFFDQVTAKIAQKPPGMTCSDSSSATSTTTINAAATPSPSTTTVGSFTRPNKKKNVSGTGVVKNSEPAGNSATGSGNGAPAVKQQRNGKRTKAVDDSTETPTRHAKVKKEKLGERVIALQQLVSPFGKTDTASVLHEAMGYIRFLQDQVQVLCSPYLQRLPSSAHLLGEEGGGGGRGGGESRKDLRSQGLCLAPIELTLHVAETNGADFWSPAMVNNKLSSSSSSNQTKDLSSFT